MLFVMQANNDPDQPQDAPVATDAAEPVSETPAADPAPALDPWEELEAEAAKWKEISLRTAAEMENLRKRTTRDREDAIRYANQRLLEDLIPVIDNFEMGMQAASQDTKSMIYIGMDMVRRQLNEFLASQSVEEIPASSTRTSTTPWPRKNAPKARKAGFSKSPAAGSACATACSAPPASSFPRSQLRQNKAKCPRNVVITKSLKSPATPVPTSSRNLTASWR
jgi:hypothetical protein